MGKLQNYYVNNDSTKNPNWHHEVHTEEHANELGIRNITHLGYFNNCYTALSVAKRIYSDSDGCKTCCPECNSDR